ncbi:amylo-alpha-1,6-glucosidase [Photobacterium sp. OFAV2-7]|uniref:amylo-alpha-1,6-glucosidase n=1 Tax=Photobacterium sp. OFAV2-7 TaxID=2917748 RepID=UPI001EF5D6AE|nr:amylo-alpha-1,6-glucosidase [Photobacterium sp. OFAV2-7]MCG7587163.1 amylo-alpha-1,6-glucosidase [Photobacterium sp. OFAV2-7]
MKPCLIVLSVAAAMGLTGCISDSGSTSKTQETVNEATVADDKPIISAKLYLRGLNGDWGTAPHAKLVSLGSNEYETVLRVGRGTNQFKIADPNWQIEYTNYQVPVELDKNQSYFPKPETNDDCMDSDCNSQITFAETGYYKFRVSFVDARSATMRVSKATQQEAEKYYQDAIIDPDMVHQGHQKKVVKTFTTYDGKEEHVTFSVKDPNSAQRVFGISTTSELRDALDQGLYVTEQATAPRVVSEDVEFDALFALTLKELDQLSVSEIRDGNYNNNQPIKAEVFETGAKWHYVWTRDLAYAADLSLALINPVRVKNGLIYKLSEFRDGTPKVLDGEQIIQDTGTGGSWPISTDRTSWALGAERLLSALSGEEYNAFAERAYNALHNTLEADRVAAFDNKSGLYQGEQSFLDWREQTYSTWTPNDVNAIGNSKALSTNIVHYRALRLAAKLGEQFDSTNGAKYTLWADQLKQAINTKFWDSSRKMYVSYLFDNQGDVAVDKYDMLGEALAITSGIASDEQARQIMANYPHSQFGVPVYFPQQPDIAVYHNRAIWPFVTGYSLRAAQVAKNTAAANNAVQSLIRGTAINLSNMENLEWLSGQSFIIHSDFGKDSKLDGPVINSQRQLWSVGSYINMVVENVFGVDTSDSSLQVKPFITGWMRNELFKNSNQIKLENFQYKGQVYTIVINLPEVDQDMTGYFEVASVINTDNVITATLGQRVAGDNSLTVIQGVQPYDTDSSKVFSPDEPNVKITKEGDTVTVEVDANGMNYNLYRNNSMIQNLISQAVTTDSPQGYACYLAETVNEQGYRSNPSQPACIGEEIKIALAGDKTEIKTGVSVVSVTEQSSTMTSETSFNVAQAGEYLFSALYSNNQGQLNTGITNGVKRLSVLDGSDQIIGTGIIQMGHVGEDKGLRYSTPISVDLTPGSNYRIEIKDYFNMSYLESNSTYIYSGGIDGPVNAADIAHIRVTRKAD